MGLNSTVGRGGVIHVSEGLNGQALQMPCNEYRRNFVAELMVMLTLLVGCGSDKAQLRAYLGEVSQSSEAMRAACCLPISKAKLREPA